MLSIAECWQVLESHAKVNAPNFGATLPEGASLAEIHAAETALGVEFSADLRQLFLCHDGSYPFYITPYEIGGEFHQNEDYEFLSLEPRLVGDSVLSHWKHGLYCEQASSAETTHEGPVKECRWNARWIPFAHNVCGHDIFIDLDPPAGGTLGQVVHYCCDFRHCTWQAASLREWFNVVATRVKAGVYSFQTVEE